MSIKDFFGFSKKKQAETDQIEEEVKETKEKQEEEKETAVVPKSHKKTKTQNIERIYTKNPAWEAGWGLNVGF